MKYQSKNLLENLSILGLFSLSLLVILHIDSEISIYFLLFLFFLKIFFIIWLCSIKKVPADPREPIFVLALIDGVFFGLIYFILYFFFRDTRVMSLPYFKPENLIYAYFVNTVGWVSFVIGYFVRMSYKTQYPLLIDKNFLSKIRRSLPIGQGYSISNYQQLEIVILIWLGFSLFINSLLFLARSSLRGGQNLPSSIAFLLTLLGNVDILLVSLTTVIAAKMNTNQSKSHPRSILILFTIVSVITAARLLTSTAKEEIIIPIVISLFAWFLRTKTFPKKPLFIFLAIYMVFAPINAFLRNDPQVLIKQKIEFEDYIRVGSSLLDLISNNEDFLFDLIADTIARFELIGISSKLIEGVRNGVIQTTDGASFLPFVYIFMPRILFPFKPSNAELYSGNELGRLTGVIAPNDFATSIAFGPSAELYLNFKIPAVILGMILLGYVLRSFYELVVQKTELSDLAIIVLSFPLYSFFRSYTSSFSALAGTIPSAIVSLVLVMAIYYIIPTYRDEK